MNIFLHELRSNLRSLLIWSVFLIFFTYMSISKFSAFAADPAILEMLDAIPAPIIEALSMDAFNMATIEGYFGIMFTYYALMVGVFAVLLGSDIIAKEEIDKTVEFSLTLPISRRQLVTGKLLAAVVNCTAFVLILWGVTLAFTASFDPTPAFHEFIRLSVLALYVLSLIFLAIGIMISSVMKQYRRASSVASSLLLSTYIFSVISGMHEKLEFLKYVSPFKYFDAVRLLNESSFDPFFVWLSAGLIVACIAIAYISYDRRDLAI